MLSPKLLVPFNTLISICSATPLPFLPHRTSAGGMSAINPPLFFQSGNGRSLNSRYTYTNTSSTNTSTQATDTYVTYTGDGSTWPSYNDWVATFDDMFNNNAALISDSCAQFSAALNTQTETDDIATAIRSAASVSGLDARFILAILLQESSGCVRAPTTNNGVRNPGLMQSHDGSGTCNDPVAGVPFPCPNATIAQMVDDGVKGTAAGDGLQQCFVEIEGTTNAAKRYYETARMYNSGTVSASGDLGLAEAGTPCYASDVANRLMGWVSAPRECCVGSTGCTTSNTTVARRGA